MISLGEMKSRRYIIMVLVALLLFGGCVWLLWPTRASGQSVTLTRVTNDSVQSSNAAAFCVANVGPRAILLTDLIVEVGTPTGWRAFSHTVPTHPQRLATGDTKDVVVGVPSGAGPWRLRVTYGTDAKGPTLLIAKADYAIFHLRLPGPGFGVMAGSNSVVSVEIPN